MPPNKDTSYDYIFPCATQNEIDKKALESLINSRKVCGIFEGANIPISLDGQAYIRQCKKNIIYIPGKAANAGGVGVSGFEMSQNTQKMAWDPSVVDEKLQNLMKSIYQQLVDVAGEHDTLEIGANQAGFIKLVSAMNDLGWLGGTCLQKTI